MTPRLRALLLAGGALFTAAAQAADKVAVQLDWLPGGDKSFVYAGLKEGYFAAEGLEVTIAPGRGSSDALTKVATGAADVGFAGISALMMAAAESPVPVKAVMSLHSKQPAAADLKAAVPEADATVLEAEFRASIPLLHNEISQRDGMGAYDPKLLAATWGWVAKSMNIAPTRVDPEKLVDRSFLPK